METKKKNYINEINIEIRNLESYNKVDDETIQRFKTNKERCVQIQEKINERNSRIEEKKREIDECFIGNLDSLIESQFITNEKEKVKHKNKKMEKEIMTKGLNDQKRKQRQENDAERELMRTMRYEYKRFCSLVDTIPPYMLRNLKEMPNNKGYIYKGIRLYGSLARDPNCGFDILFERKGKSLLIYEIDQYEKRTFEKKENERRVLIEKTRRIRKVK